MEGTPSVPPLREPIPCFDAPDAPNCKTATGGANVIVNTISGETVTETFVPTTYTEWTTLTAPTTIVTKDSLGNDASILVGSGGVGWKLPTLSSGEPLATEPTVLPTIANPASGGQLSGGQQTGTQPAAGQSTGALQPTAPSGQSTGQPTGGQPTGGQPTGGQPTGGQSTGVQPSGDRSGSLQPTGGHPSSVPQPSGGSPSTGGPQTAGSTGQATGSQAQTGTSQPTIGQGQTTGSLGQSAGVQPTSGQGQTAGSSQPADPSASVPGAVVVSSTISGQLVAETFVPTTISSLISLTSELSTFTQVAPSSSIPIVVGPGGIAWQIPIPQSGKPQIPPPTTLPSGSNPSAVSTNLPSLSSGTALPTGDTTSTQGGTASSGAATTTPSNPTNTDGNEGPSQTNAPGQTTEPPKSSDQVTAPPLPIITNTNPIVTEKFSTLPPGITGNTLYHTKDSSGHDSVAPFLWHCFFCGGGGIVLGGFGKLTISIIIMIELSGF